MEIKYNNKIINYDDFLKPSETKQTPDVNITDLGYKYYTLIMYDPDAVGGNYWHWVVSNIKNGKINSNKAILSYKGPSPPDDKIHHYIFELYGSEDKFKILKEWKERHTPLNVGKEVLGLKERPIIQVLFRSQREKSIGGRTFKKKKRIYKTRKNNRYRK